MADIFLSCIIDTPISKIPKYLQQAIQHVKRREKQEKERNSGQKPP